MNYNPGGARGYRRYRRGGNPGGARGYRGNRRGGNQGGNPGGNPGGNQGGNPGGNQGGNPGGNRGGNQGGNPGGNQGGNQVWLPRSNPNLVQNQPLPNLNNPNPNNPNLPPQNLIPGTYTIDRTRVQYDLRNITEPIDDGLPIQNVPPNMGFIPREIQDLKFEQHPIHSRVFTANRRRVNFLFTRNIPDSDDSEYIFWDSEKCKIAASISAGIDAFLLPDSDVLYVGPASRETVYHLSNMASPGTLYVMDIAPAASSSSSAPSPYRTEVQPNVKFVNGVWSDPESYSLMHSRILDLIVVDLGTTDEVSILVGLSNMYLKHGGKCMMIIKAYKDGGDADYLPKRFFYQAKEALKANMAEGFKVIDDVSLPNFGENWACILGQL